VIGLFLRPQAACGRVPSSVVPLPLAVKVPLYLCQKKRKSDWTIFIYEETCQGHRSRRYYLAQQVGKYTTLLYSTTSQLRLVTTVNCFWNLDPLVKLVVKLDYRGSAGSFRG